MGKINQYHIYHIILFFCREHNITLLSGFRADFAFDGLFEITPTGLVDYIQNYTKNWDLVGARMRGDLPISVWDIMRYPVEVRYLCRLKVYLKLCI